jgi:signal transduction histidine kinase
VLSSQDATSSPRGSILATAWPAISREDADSLRRRKVAVRGGHLAMAFMVLAAVGSALIAAPGDYSRLEIAVLGVGSLVYVLWNAAGTRGIVTLVLWDKGVPPPISARVPRCGALLYFTVQVALAGLIYWIGDRGRVPNLVWLSLLPPVAYAVFLLEWRGIALVSVLVMGILVASFWRWHHPTFAAYAALAFSFAILFTIIFTMLAVQSEKARNEVQRLAGELSEANRRLREYAVQAEELSANRERIRLAREVHDSLGHYLTVVSVQLEAARALWASDSSRAREALAKAQTLAQEGLQDIRRSVASLRSSPLDNKPLAEALRALVADDSQTVPAAAFQVIGAPRDLASPVALSMYRAAQEGLTNARKHARATHVSVLLDFRSPSTVALTVSDDGRGAEGAGDSGGFGLLGLRERALLLGGNVRVQTAPGEGFTLTFEVPA